MVKVNKGILTEQSHYQQLVSIFGDQNVSSPKGSTVGSDFVVNYKGTTVSFESKTSVTDIFDAGSIKCWSNAHITGASSYLSDEQLQTIQGIMNDGKEQIQRYCDSVKVDMFPHRIATDTYESAKRAGNLVHLTSKKVKIPDLVKSSLIQSLNRFVKANYLLIADDLYCICPSHDPLGLSSKGANVIGKDEFASYYSLRAGRSGSKNGLTSINLRLQYRLCQNTVPSSNIKISNLGEHL